MASADMPPLQALRVATLYGAEAIGLGQDLGSLEPGKLADLVILSENPLSDIRHTNSIHQVMMNGRLFMGDTLDEVWPAVKPLGTMWWWDEDPVDVPGSGTHR